MTGISESIKKLDLVSQALGAVLSKASGQYLASAVYLSSLEKPDTAFALSHAGGNYQHIQRTDKHVFRRALSSEESVATHSLMSAENTMRPSLMFPGHHDCAQIALFPNRKTEAERAVLQVVFNAKAAPALKDLQKFIHAQESFKTMPSVLDDIMDETDGDRDRILHVRPPYQPNAIVMFCDISKFTNVSDRAGYYRAQDSADAFCQNFVRKYATYYDATLLRYEGDGIWLSFPITKENKTQQIKNSYDMARQVAENFPAFISSADHAFENAHVKIVMELGEVRDYFWDETHQQTQKPDDRSGPVFSHIRRASKDNLQNANVILVGPELALAHKNDIRIYDIVPSNFNLLTP